LQTSASSGFDVAIGDWRAARVRVQNVLRMKLCL
jgi:hypothetical protein